MRPLEWIVTRIAPTPVPIYRVGTLLKSKPAKKNGPSKSAY